MKSFFCVLNGVSVIIGAVIGAGFITGRELLTFFNGFDAALTSIAVFFLFFLYIKILLRLKVAPNGKTFNVFMIIIYIGNFIISAGMVSVIIEIEKIVFDVGIGIILSVITLVFSNIVLYNGIDFLKTVNLIAVFVIIVVTITVLKCATTVQYVFINKFGLFTSISYVSMNMFMNSFLIIKLGEEMNKKCEFLTALISAFILSFFIFYIFSSLSSESIEITSSSVPLLKLISRNLISKYIFAVVMYFGVFTTLLSSLYPIFEFAKEFKQQKIAIVILNLSVFGFSLIGFANIINYLYPFLGILGLAYFILILLSRVKEYLILKKQKVVKKPLNFKEKTIA